MPRGILTPDVQAAAVSLPFYSAITLIVWVGYVQASGGELKPC